ncbi:MAG: efflux RND transporter periplasmic adaptor subunit [Phycisphaeraceae bacterium]|nr:efflux RND transporter periplasmic adaptor subunit [Phycisphaeraceae bacterium]
MTTSQFSAPRWALAAVIAGAALGACDQRADRSGASPAASTRDPAPVPVGLVPVRIGPALRTVDVTGTLLGEEEATIASKLSGRIESIALDIGDAASSGTVLARIEARDYELSLAEAEAALAASLARLGLSEVPDPTFDRETLPAVRRARAEAANARARFDRARQLFEQTPPLISEQDFADIRTTFDVARENAEAELMHAAALLADVRSQETAVSIARQRLTDAAVRSPVDELRGPIAYRVAARLVNTGEYVTPGTPMFRLVASDTLKFRADVPERFAGQMSEGRRARVWVESRDEPTVGSVTRVSPRIDAASRTFVVEIGLDNRDGRLRAGAFGRGQIELRQDEGVMFVPVSAVVTFAGVRRVFTVEDGKAREHRVQLGARDGDFVEISPRLKAGHVVGPGAANLAEGMAVAVREEN